MIVDDEKIVEELLKVGIKITGIYDLVNTNQSYSAAIPVLIELLDESFASPRVTEGIIRALTVKEAGGKANNRLLRTYNETPRNQLGLRWVIGNAFATVITPDDANELLKIVKDITNGTSRQMFVFALGKIKSPDVEDTLITLLDDDEVALHAISALRKLRVIRSLPKIEKLTSSKYPGIKKAANSFIKKFASDEEG